MSSNKIIFIIIGVILVLGFSTLFLNLNNSQTQTPTQIQRGDFAIWIMDDKAEDFQKYLEEFKLAFPKYTKTTFSVESFTQADIYMKTLSSAIVNKESPDIFVLDNRETSPLQNQISGIDPNIISPNDFRLRFHPRFSEDLIITDTSDEGLEFLQGVPLGFETLGVYYSRKHFLRPSEMTTWSDFTKEVQSIHNKDPNITPVALGNTHISHSADIMSQFFTLSGKKNIYDTDRTDARNMFALYRLFGERTGDNRYDVLTNSFSGKTDVEYFTEGDVAAMIGFPRDLIKISDIGYQKSFLFATPFPHFAGSEPIQSVKYKYFSINKDSEELGIAQDLLSFMASPEGQRLYIEIFSYYLSPEVALSQELAEKKIIPEYNIVYKNFFEEGSLLQSYDMGSVTAFSDAIEKVLSNDSNMDQNFTILTDKIICGVAKYTTLLNLSNSCE